MTSSTGNNHSDTLTLNPSNNPMISLITHINPTSFIHKNPQGSIQLCKSRTTTVTAGHHNTLTSIGRPLNNPIKFRVSHIHIPFPVGVYTLRGIQVTHPTIPGMMHGGDLIKLL
jgi:hypothetical protein